MQDCTAATSKEELRERLGPISDAAVVAAQELVDEAREQYWTTINASGHHGLLWAAFSACGVKYPSYLGRSASYMIDLLWPLCTKANSDDKLRNILKVGQSLEVLNEVSDT